MHESAKAQLLAVVMGGPAKHAQSHILGPADKHLFARLAVTAEHFQAGLAACDVRRSEPDRVWVDLLSYAALAAHAGPRTNGTAQGKQRMTNAQSALPAQPLPVARRDEPQPSAPSAPQQHLAASGRPFSHPLAPGLPPSLAPGMGCAAPTDSHSGADLVGRPSTFIPSVLAPMALLDCQHHVVMGASTLLDQIQLMQLGAVSNSKWTLQCRVQRSPTLAAPNSITCLRPCMCAPPLCRGLLGPFRLPSKRLITKHLLLYHQCSCSRRRPAVPHSQYHLQTEGSLGP